MNRRTHVVTIDHGVVMLTGAVRLRPSGLYLRARLVNKRQPGHSYRYDWIAADNIQPRVAA